VAPSAPSRPEADLAAVRALGHPLRLELLDRLRFGGPSTATALGRVVGESSGATSYHLRQLARHGFIEEDAGRGRGRERWWRHRERDLELPAPRGGRGGRSGEAALAAELLSREAHALDRYLARRADHPAWQGASFVARQAALLTPSELTALARRLAEVFDELPTADRPDPPAKARPVSLLALGFPYLEDTP
jgi:DNA-binding transcriptional ArsR family regulator